MTTWNFCFFLCPYIRKNHSKPLLAISSVVSLAGITMIINSLINKCSLNWKEKKINLIQYISCELLFHQLPLFYTLGYYPYTSNAFYSLIPTTTYCIFIKNPYSINNIKLKNYYGIGLVFLMSSILEIKNKLI
tara:strand:+ start:167 stop:565 length:399 start_codon:yes stop_codon:yes gene_type:complete